MDSNILITICARGGSKGIPKKNIKPLNGIPVICYSIDLAKKISKKYNSKIALSTDDIDILNTSKKNGLFTDYLRPKNLAHDNAGKVETLKDLIEYEEKLLNGKYDYILDLDVSSPLRNLDDIVNGFNILNNDKKMLTLFSVSHPNRNPYFNVVEKNESTGYYELVKKLKEPIQSRQNAPIVFDMNSSFYWYKRSFFDTNFKSPITKNTGIYLIDHSCFDLDHNKDFLFMEYLIKSNKLDFEL